MTAASDRLQFWSLFHACCAISGPGTQPPAPQRQQRAGPPQQIRTSLQQQLSLLPPGGGSRQDATGHASAGPLPKERALCTQTEAKQPQLSWPGPSAKGPKLGDPADRGSVQFGRDGGTRLGVLRQCRKSRCCGSSALSFPSLGSEFCQN